MKSSQCTSCTTHNTSHLGNLYL